jgi:putative transposase
VERFIQSISQECLDRFVIFGEKHMDHLCQEYLAYYHEERPHQSLDNAPLNKPKKRGRPKTRRGSIADEIVPLTEVRYRQRLGELLKSYSRRAA